MSRPLRVAFLMPGLGVVNRGAEAFVYELATALGQRPDFEVVILCRGQIDLPHQRIRCVPRDSPWLNRLYRLTTIGRKIFDTLFLDPLNVEWATSSLSAYRHLRDGGFDVAVIEGGLVGLWLGRRLRRRLGTAIVDIAHGNSPKWEGAFARRKPDRVVAFTEDTAQMIRRRAPRSKVVVIPHGIDLDHFQPRIEPAPIDLEPPIVITAGALDENKRVRLVLDAFLRLGRGSLLVLGEGPEATELDRRAGQLLGPDRYLRLTVPRIDMPHWYAAADAFTLASKLESFGLVYLEAMACGLPAVGPDDAVRRQVIGEGGVVCDVEDSRAFARALTEALDQQWGDAPRRQAARFPFSATIETYAQLFRSLAAGQAPTRQPETERIER